MDVTTYDLYDVLFDYQKEGVKKICDRLDKGKGTLLADYMGLGKTLQGVGALYHFFRRNENANDPPRAVVIAPASIVSNWPNEALLADRLLDAKGKPADVAARLNVQILTSATKKAVLAKWKKEGGTLAVSYETLLSILVGDLNASELILDTRFVIADEAHRLRKPAGELHKMIEWFKQTSLLLITGFPMQNMVKELTTLVRLVEPDNPDFYAKNIQYGFEQPITKGGELRNLRALTLHNLVQDAVVRRGKDVAEKGLTAGREDKLVLCTLNELQCEMYRDYITHKLRVAQKESSENEGVLMTNQFCMKLGADPIGIIDEEESKFDQDDDSDSIDPWEFRRLFLETHNVPRPQGEEPTPWDHAYVEKAKTALLVQNLKQPKESRRSDWFEHNKFNDLKARFRNTRPDKLAYALDVTNNAWVKNEKTLVFSQVIPTLDRVQKMMTDENYTVYRIDGSTAQSLRKTIVDEFTNDKQKCVFLASTMAAGEGLNIQSANHVVLMDSSWNPCPDEQVICRAYRKNQTRKVFVHRLVNAGTLEEIVVKTQYRKAAVASRVVDDVYRQDLEELDQVRALNLVRTFNALHKLGKNTEREICPIDVAETPLDHDEAFRAKAEKAYRKEFFEAVQKESKKALYKNNTDPLVSPERAVYERIAKKYKIPTSQP